MRFVCALLLLGLAGLGSAGAQGRLVPTDQTVPPLALSRHEVKVTIEDQVAITHVEQTFRNPTSRNLEATYVFPVPKGASVNEFVMWVDGKKVKGELVEADKARTIYTDIVRRMQDPGLLEYMGSSLLKVRVFPVPANGEQKLAVSYTSLANSDTGMVEYVYPLKADGNAFRNVEKFTFEATVKAQQPIQNVYSPTHAVTIRRPNDREAVIRFDGRQETLDRDFQLYYSSTAKDVGVTALTHRTEAGKDGHFMLLISPRTELSKTQHVPRDVVFVLDTSGSMAGKRIEQARNALKFCLRNLHANDRFGMIHFATTVNKYQDKLLDASESNIAAAQKWVDNLEATGSTCIDEALSTALAMRPTKTTRTAYKLVHTSYNENHDGYVESKAKVEKVPVDVDENRNFTIVFFTDGQPTIGECHPEKIVKNVVAKNTADTRIFTFGVGDDVNAVLLDQLAEKTNSVATYVRESEDIEAKVSSFYSKISHPVLTNLKLTVKHDIAALRREMNEGLSRSDFFSCAISVSIFNKTVSWKEIYPQQLPDLFHGSQLVVLGRYSGYGTTKVILTGMVGNEKKEFTYDVAFPEKTDCAKAFVEDLWARRKVGYLLDQIRVNGESKEVKEEVIALAKKYGITTPYTSYLVVPDVAPAVAAVPQPLFRNGTPPSAGALPDNWNQYQGSIPPNPVFGGTGSVSSAGTYYMQTPPVASAVKSMPQANPVLGQFSLVLPPLTAATTSAACCTSPSAGQKMPAAYAQSGKEAVDLSLHLNAMRNQDLVAAAAVCQANGRTCRNVNGVWLDEGINAKMPIVKIKAQSTAYFRMLERHPEMKEVFQLGNRTAWVTPNQNVLVIDAAAGEASMSDADIDRLFVVKK